MHLPRRRPSPALIIALVALFASLGGTAWAVARITGRDVVDRSLTYHDIARNTIGPGEAHNLRGFNLQRATVGGYQTDEATLGKVPSAAAADTAGGLAPKKFVTKIAADAPEQTVLSLGGMTLLASCPGGIVQLRAITAESNAELAASSVGNNDVPHGVRSGDFDTGQSVDVDQGIANGSGTLDYATTGGTAVSASFGVGSTTSFGGTSPGCAVYGTALGG